jgi:transposase-like protein
MLARRAVLAVFSLPEPVRASLRTTNLLERAFRELRRRLRPIGSLADRRSADRILYGGVLRLKELLTRRRSPDSHKSIDVTNSERALITNARSLRTDALPKLGQEGVARVHGP